MGYQGYFLWFALVMVLFTLIRIKNDCHTAVWDQASEGTIMNQYIPQKYNFLELTFGQYKIVRMLSRAFWVKMKEPGYSWVKFDKEQFKKMQFVKGTEFEIEDYTGSL